MTIERPTRSYLYGSICNKCLETLIQLLDERADSVSSALLNAFKYEAQLRREHSKATELAERALLDGEPCLVCDEDD